MNEISMILCYDDISTMASAYSIAVNILKYMAAVYMKEICIHYFSLDSCIQKCMKWNN